MSTPETPRPLWRWWLWCAALWVYARTKGRINRWALDLYGWCVLPEWVDDRTEAERNAPPLPEEEMPF